MRLVIDLRRAFDSGLGTYIRHVVPRTLARLPGVPALGLVGPEGVDRHRAYLDVRAIGLQLCDAVPLTLSEQWRLRRCIPSDAVFWATTLAHPLYTRQRLVATVHDVLQLALPPPAGGSKAVRWASRMFLHSLHRRAELLLFNSAFTAAEFRRLVGETPAAQVVTPLGVEPCEWAPAAADAPVPGGVQAQRPYFLYVGNFRAHKNLPRLLAAWSRVATSLPHDLLLIGRSLGFRDEAHGISEQLAALAPRARHLGELPDRELRQWVAGATALVMPSLYEGFGLPVLEAMAAGCPVIASTAASLREVGADAAMYFEPHDVTALAQCLLAMAHMTAADRRAWMKRGQARAATFTWDRTAALTASSLQTMLNTPHRRS